MIKRNLVLIGLPGSGKSTVSALLSRRLGWPLLDTDEMVVQREGRTIPEIFACEGEDYFRRVETVCAREAAGTEEAVIATGGGIVLREENMTALRRSGFVCFLDRGAAEIAEGLDISGRPLLREGREKIYRLARERDALYRKYADVVVSEKTPEAGAEDVSCGNQKTLCHWRSGGAQPVAGDSQCGFEADGTALCVWPGTGARR